MEHMGKRQQVSVLCGLAAEARRACRGERCEFWGVCDVTRRSGVQFV